MKTYLINGNIITGSRIIEDGGISICDGLIESVFEMQMCPDFSDSLVYDCAGCYISPGFIDTHVHGGAGSDFIDGTPEAIENIVKLHSKHGTTSLLAATLSTSRENITCALENITKFQQNHPLGCFILGVHLEGNYFSMNQKGAHNPDYIYPPQKEEYLDYIKRANILMVSAAPEIENGLVIARDLCQLGIVMSIAHSDANYQQTLAAFESGYTHITHIFNGLSSLRNLSYYAQIGVCEAALQADNIYVETIADGRHLPPELLNLIYKIKGADHMHAVTDSVRPTGFPDGVYTIGGLEVIVEDNVSKLIDRSSFAGSVATTDLLARVLYKKANIPILDVVKMLSTTPANIIGYSNKLGKIAEGYQADINVFDYDINILKTFKNGKLI